MSKEFSEKDFRIANSIVKSELIEPLNLDNMFKAGIYSILSSTENHRKHLKIYNKLISRNLSSPESILNRRKEFHDVVKIARFPNNKEKHMVEFSRFWQESELPEMILEDANNRRERGHELRNLLAKDAPGMELKCSSFEMQKCGFEDTVMIDLWVIRYLSKEGYDVKIPDYKTVSGMKWKDYINYEIIISEIADDYNVKPVIMQCAIWAKYSPFSSIYSQKTLDNYF